MLRILGKHLHFRCKFFSSYFYTYQNCNGNINYTCKQQLHSSQHGYCQFFGETNESLGPLSGIRILDMTRVLAGPFATMLLADLGATVIKVERPGMGDETRMWGPPFLGSESCYFLSVNRSKISLAVNLKSQEGVEIVTKLAHKCDVLMENFIPGVLSRLGLGYSSLKAAMPHLIYCSLTGYGPTGPYSSRPGYDIMAASLGGLMSVTGPSTGPPCKVGVAITDIATGLYAHGAILAALIERGRTGKGQKIDCDLLATQIACMANLASNYLNAGWEPKPHGTAHESIVPYQAFPTADGYICVAGNNNHQFISLCGKLDLPHLVSDERYIDNSCRVENRDILISELSSRISEHTTQQWLNKFEGAPFPYAPINTLSQTFNDPQVIHKQLVETLHHPTAGDVRVVGPAVQFSESVNRVRSAPPVLGEHTRAVLVELLGYTHQQVEEFHGRGVVHCSDSTNGAPEHSGTSP